MPSLRSIFTLQDNYSRSMDRIWTSTQRATSGIDRASSAVDNVNSKFTATESSAGRLTSRLTGLAAAFLSIQTIKKGMEISDTYTNISSKLSLITSNAAQLKSLQNDIFAAADRARGSYTDMADTVARLGITAGSQFGSNQNIVKFAETMQKMFRVGGASTAEQSAAMLQITQAIGSGKLQGDEFRSIMENAPMAAQAIAKYLGTSTDKLKELSTDGKLTSDVIINGVLSASASVDQQVSKMSYTWGDYWNKIKNGAYQAFGETFGDESNLLESQNFQNMVNVIIASFSVLAKVANDVMTVIADVGGFIADNWSIILPILLGAIGVFVAMQLPILAAAAATAWKTICDWAETVAILAMIAAQDGLNAALAACPITWIIAAIIIAIALVYTIVAAVNKFTNQSLSATGIILGSVLFLAATVYDILLGALNGMIQLIWSIFVYPFLGIIEWVLNAANGGFDGFGGAVANLIGQIIGWFLSLGQIVTKIIDAIFGTNWTAGLESLKNNVTAWGKTDKAITINKSAPTIGQRWDEKSAWNVGYKFGQGIDAKINNWMKNLGQTTSQKTLPMSQKTSPTPKTPIPVTGTGADGSVKVNIADQDLQYLRDLAEKQYINKFSTAVLSPKLSVSFSGNVGDKNDQQQIYFTISKMLQEELATAAEGLYE
ncbi:tape measure protein [Caproiciproducens sp. LBM24188]